MTIGWQVKTGLALFLSATLLAGSVFGAERSIRIGGLEGLNPYDTTKQYQVALALSGGGARGLAIIGILKAFEEKNISVQAIAGTSMGGIIGGLYASGYSPNQLEEIVSDIDFDLLFSNAPTRSSMFLTQRQERDRHLLSIRFRNFVPVIPKALTAGQKLTNVLTNLTTRASYLSAGNYDRLEIPFRTVCTDIVTGREEVIAKGSLSEAMRATMAFPLAFTGVERDGKLLMDGGMVTPVPVDLVRSISPPEMFVVAINSTSPLLPASGLSTPIDIANQVTSIMTADKLKAQLDKADYVIRPDNNHSQTADFSDRDKLIKTGYQNGLTAADSIIAIIDQKEESRLLKISDLTVAERLKPYLPQFQDRLSGKSFTHLQLVAIMRELTVQLDLFELSGEWHELIIPETSGDSSSTIEESLSLNLSGAPSPVFDSLTFRFVGNTIFDDLELASQLQNGENRLSADQLQRGLDRILNLYFEKGYDLVDITSVDIDFDRYLITITVDEAIIRTVAVTGNHRTRGWFIRSYFPLRKGEPYSTGRAASGIANIYGTDLFDRVTVDLRPADSGAIVELGVVEKHYNQLRLGWHWDDHYESEGFAELLDDNILGVGLEYLLHAGFGPDRRRFAFSLKTNRIGPTYLTATTDVYHRQLDRQIYNEEGEPREVIAQEKTGFGVELGQQIARLGTVTTGINLEEVKTRDSRTGDTDHYGLRVFRLASLFESFDRHSFTTEGAKLFMEFKFVGKFLGGDVEYTRFHSSLEKYQPLTSHLNFHIEAEVGLSRSGLPISEKFFLGGIDSFYGFHNGEHFGDKIFRLSNEIRLRLPFRFYLSARYDVGDVYRHTDEIKLSQLRQGLGALIAFDSPIGPFKFGYGKTDNKIDKFYFSAGLAF